MGGQTHPTFHPTLVFSMLDEMLDAFDHPSENGCITCYAFTLPNPPDDKTSLLGYLHHLDSFGTKILEMGLTLPAHAFEISCNWGPILRKLYLI